VVLFLPGQAAYRIASKAIRYGELFAEKTGLI